MGESPPPRRKPLRVALLGAGTIARLVLDHARRGELAGVNVIAIAGRQGSARTGALARDFEIPLVLGREALFAARPDAVLEAASHDAVREHLVALLDAGISVVGMSAGALADDALRTEAERAAKRGGAQLYVPSGGSGGLDAPNGACPAGAHGGGIDSTKPSAD